MHKKKIIPAILAACLSLTSASLFAAEDQDEDQAVSAKPAKKAKKSKKKSSGPVFKIDRAKVETGMFLDNAAPATNNYAHLSASMEWKLSREVEIQLGARVDGSLQTSPDAHRLRADYTENFVRWRGDGFRFTAGTQNITWGRTDEIPPTDQLSRVDLTRLNLDPLAERRRAVPALRLEKTLGEYKLDTVWVPSLQPAELPPWKSVWHPVDRTRGVMLGVAPDPVFTYLVQNGSFAEDKSGAGGGGFRLTRTGGSFDWGLSVQRARRSTPYYQLNPEFRNNLIANAGNYVLALAATTGPTFTAVHPMSTVLGGELEFQAAGATWRMEATRSSDVPATTQDLRYIQVPALDVVAGMEFYPGDADTRVTLQLASHHLSTSESLVERKTFNAVTGDIEHPFGGDRWRLNLRWLAGLNHRDNYVSPKLTYRGFEPHELYVAAHFYGGDAQGLGGFHRDHDLVMLGWQVRY